MRETPQQYIKRMRGYITGKDPVDVLSNSPKQIGRLIKGVSKKKLARRTRPNAWSVTEILAHLADAELVVGFRLRLILGANKTSIQAFDQDVWAKVADYSSHDPVLSFEAYRVNRERNLRLLKSLTPAMWKRYGMHAERGKESVARIAEMMAGHDMNHVGQIRRLLK